MNISEKKQERHELLESMEDDLQKDLIAAKLNTPEEENGHEILSVMYDALGMEEDPVFGEFYFLDIPDEEAEVQHFCATLTLADDVESEHLPELFEAMSYINAALPCGSYRVDMDKKFLSFHLAVPLSIDMDKEALYEEMHIVLANAISICDVYMDLILKIMAGTETLDYVKEVLNPMRNE